MRKRILFIFCVCTTMVVHAQIPNGQGGFIVPAIVKDGDTMSVLQLPGVDIVSKMLFASKRDEERYWRLVYNVRKVYPYAKLAGEQYRYYDSILAKETNERKRSALMKQAEKDIKKQFEKELRNLTVTQGKILVKLLDRETTHSAFNLVKDLRNAFQAYLYQGIGRLFGYNLKTKYDPHGADRDIENIVRLLELGIIEPIPISVKGKK